MKWVIHILTLFIYRVIAWSPSDIEGIIYCDVSINRTIDEYDQHYWALTIHYNLNITLSTCYSTFDTQIKVFNSNGLEISAQYCDGDDCPDSKTKCINDATNREFFTMPLNVGIYYIRINGFSSGNGIYVIQTICSQLIENTRSNIVSTNEPQYNMYTMIELNTPLICNELMDSIDIIYNIDYNLCVYNCLNISTCIMINYINNFKTETDSRCYLYDKQCDLKIIENPKNKVAIKSYNIMTNNKCINYPIDWMDSFGDNCYDYVKFNWCLNGNMNKNISINNFIEIKDNKYELTALDVCCECGNGIYTFDNINIKYIHSIDILIDNNKLCPWNYIQSQKQKWNVFNFYQLCIQLMQTNDFNCDVLFGDNIAYTQNVSVIQCDFNQFILNRNESNETIIYFIMLIGLNNNYQNTIYINNEWFNDNNNTISHDYISFNYEECMDELLYEHFNEFYIILPCDLNNKKNISFISTTEMYTTKMKGTDSIENTMTTMDISDTIVTMNDNNGNTAEFILKDALSVIFIIGFVIIIGIVILFIIWFCKHTKKKDKQTKIEFSKLKTEVRDIGRRHSVISLSNQNIHIAEEEKIAIVRVNTDEVTDEDDILHNNQCLLCCNNIANVVLWPCAHVCYCNECATNAIQNNKFCPQCRDSITDFKQIFRGGFRV